MTRGIRYSPEVCERAVWMVEEQRADYGSEWGRSCSTAWPVFFARDAVTIEETPQGAGPDTDALFAHAGLELGERGVALLIQQRHISSAWASVFDERRSPPGFRATARPCSCAS